MPGSPAELSPVLALDTRIITKEECLSSLHWFTHNFSQSISKLRLKSTSCFYFSIEIFWQKKGEAFQFHSLQNTQVFIALYFSLSTSLREAGLMTSMYAALIHNAIQPSDVCCKRSLNTIRSLLLACTQLWACPERQRSAVSECKLTVLFSWGVPFSAAFSQTGPIFFNVAKFCCYSCKGLWIKL